MCKKNVFYSDLPKYSSIQLDDTERIIKNKLKDCFNAVYKITSGKLGITWFDRYESLVIAENELKKVWSPIVYLNSVKREPKLRLIYENNLISILKYKNWVNHHYGLYQSYQSLRKHFSYRFLSITQKLALNKVLDNYKLSGIYLSGDKKKHYINLIARLSKLGIDFSNNVLDSTLNWKKLITNKYLLSGIPDNKLRVAQLAAKNDQQMGWLFTLQYPSYLSILLYCDDSTLREELYWAFNTRASDQGPHSVRWDNTSIISEILSLRCELAQILGFNSYLEWSLKKRMMKNSRKIYDFLINLSTHVRFNASKEFLKMQDFAKKHYSCTVLKPWDIAYYQEKQKLYYFSISEDMLSSYFPEEQVLLGMFKIVNYIYDITIKGRNNVDKWDPNVKFFDVFNAKDEWQGGFYMDLYVRENKNEGAWMDVCLDNFMYKNNIYYKNQNPIAYLTCNFNPPEKFGKPCLLTYDNVITLFHEFGHVLHHILTRTSIPSISGINSVPLDLIEIPSQFMEKFCWEPSVLKLISLHYKRNEPLSDVTINNLVNLRTYQISFCLLKQIIYGLFDFKIHCAHFPKEKISAFSVFNKISKNLSVYPVMKSDRFLNTFTHIFSDDYAAGYYSYLWSDMLASQMWLFVKKKHDNKIRNIGRSLFKSMLCLSISRNLKKCFIGFYGKTVTTKSILQYYNMMIVRDTFFKLF